MAHEELKFKISAKANNTWQPIYGGQEYGTFFMIYMRITNYEVITEDGVEGKSHIYTCDYRIQNFVGAVTLGLYPYAAGSKSIDEAELENLYYGKTYSKSDMEKMYDFLPPSEREKLFFEVGIHVCIRPFLKNEIITNRKLNFNRELQSGDRIETECRTELPPTELYDQQNPLDAAYLNPNDFIRSGDWVTEIGTRKYDESGKGAFIAPTVLGGGSKHGKCIPNRSEVM